MNHPETFDVIVVGGGHAGTEAALAAARMGAKALLLTQSIETIGQMSCNPAVGGIGKTHLVKEIDALDGAMARATDRAGIHFRVLNASKGPAVRATRAQADRALYRGAIRHILESQENLSLFQQSVVDLDIENDRICGVVTEMGLHIEARAVVLTTGTFLGGRIHIGLENHPGGRAGDSPSNALAERLRALPVRVARLKTGTPPRIDGRSVDFTVMAEQQGDEPTPAMSYLGKPEEHPRQISCFITHTNPGTHEVIRAALGRSPLFTGLIEGRGPRYCPSIEDKVVRFADRNAHQIFVEPEGLETVELYPNGISTSLPFDVQLAFVRSIRGFEHARITRPGYAIEYDFFDPRDLSHCLETKCVEGLFFAGQINGTTGYEEAAAQGLLAGINAARKVANASAWCPGRDEAYLGVMVDDLVTHGANEPYRMFTSRAEFRLLLRQDNADLRLTETGRELGIVGDARWREFTHKRSDLLAHDKRLHEQRIRVGSDLASRVERAFGLTISRDVRAFDLLKRPSLTYQGLADVLGWSSPGEEVALQLDVQAKYHGYIERQREDVARLKRHEHVTIPQDLDYLSMAGLSNELRQKLSEARPATLARAARLPGMTPAALSLLLVRLKSRERARESAGESA